VSFGFNVILSKCHFVQVSFCPSVILSKCHFVQVSFCPSVILSKCHFFQVHFVYKSFDSSIFARLSLNSSVILSKYHSAYCHLSFCHLGSCCFTNCHLTVLKNTGWPTVIRSNDIRSILTARFKNRVRFKNRRFKFSFLPTFCRRRRCRRRRWR
jgi:hypothetical protein